MMYSFIVSVIMMVVGIVLWIEGGPHPRTRGAWVLLGAIVIVSAMPPALCWLFCSTAAAPPAIVLDSGPSGWADIALWALLVVIVGALAVAGWWGTRDGDGN